MGICYNSRSNYKQPPQDVDGQYGLRLSIAILKRLHLHAILRTALRLELPPLQITTCVYLPSSLIIINYYYYSRAQINGPFYFAGNACDRRHTIEHTLSKWRNMHHRRHPITMRLSPATLSGLGEFYFSHPALLPVWVACSPASPRSASQIPIQSSCTVARLLPCTVVSRGQGATIRRAIHH